MVGQRPLILLSRSGIILNTTFKFNPGTGGGFPGGYSIGRRPIDRLSDTPKDQSLQVSKHVVKWHTSTVSLWCHNYRPAVTCLTDRIWMT